MIHTVVIANDIRQYDIWLKENIMPDKRKYFVYVNHAGCYLLGLGVDGVIVITTKPITDECKFLLKGRFTRNFREVL